MMEPVPPNRISSAMAHGVDTPIALAGRESNLVTPTVAQPTMAGTTAVAIPRHGIHSATGGRLGPPVFARAGPNSETNRSDGNVSQAAVVVLGVVLGLACALIALCFACHLRRGRAKKHKADDSSSSSGSDTPFYVQYVYGHRRCRGNRGRRGGRSVTSPVEPPGADGTDEEAGECLTIPMFKPISSCDKVSCSRGSRERLYPPVSPRC